MMTPRDIYLALVDSDEDFNPAVHARRDLKIVDVRVVKRDEASYWSAEVDILNPGGGVFRPGAKRRAIISERDQDNGGVYHVLTGRLQGWPIGLAGDVVTLTVVAAGRTAQREALEDQALGQVDDDPWRVFTRTDATERRKPEERLSARHALLNYQRRDDVAPVLTDLIAGDGFVDLGGKFIEGTLRFTQPQSVVSRVEVTLTAEWLQAFLSVIDVGGEMLDEGIFHMLGYPDWSRFPKVGDRLGDWSVVKARIDKLPVAVGDPWIEVEAKSLNNPTLTIPAGSTSLVRFPGATYDLDLVVAAVASARRKETLRFVVQWAGTDLSDSEGLTEKIELSCSNLQGRYQPVEWQAGVAKAQGQEVSADGLAWRCIEPHVGGASIYHDLDKWDPMIVNGIDPLGGSYAPVFFGAGANISAATPNGNLQVIARDPVPGHSAILYALNQAKAKILSTMRSVTATFEVPWHYVRHLTGSERVRIADANIPGGEMIGKLVSLECSLVDQQARLTIAAAPGKGTPSGTLAQPNYTYPGIGNTGVIRAEVINDREQQQQALLQLPVTTDFQAALASMATRLEVEMAPVPKGGNAEVPIDLGTVLVDCDTMIDLEAEA